MNKRNVVRAGAALSMLFALSLTACTAPVGDDQGSEDTQVDGTDVELAIAESLTEEKLDELVAKYGECPEDVRAQSKTTTVALSKATGAAPAIGQTETQPLLRGRKACAVGCHWDELD
jgi:hypothetical protein